MSVNESVIYTPSPESLPTTDSYYTPIRPSNGSSFSPGQSIYIDVPAQRNAYLDASNSWLDFSCKFTITGSAPAASVNTYHLTSAGASGLISSLYAWSSNNSNLESITQYAELSRMLNVVSQDDTVNNSIRTITSGIENSISLNNNLLGENVYDTLVAKDLKFSIPLVSSVFGTLSAGRYHALALLNGSTRLQLDLISNAFDAICQHASTATAVTSCTFEITNVAYNAKIVRVTEAAQQAIVANARQDENGVISYSSVGWRSYPRSIAVNQSGESTFLVPARFRSLNNIIWGIRNPRSSNYAGQDPSNTYTVASSWYSRVGGVPYPSIPPNTRSSIVQYLMGAFHSISNTLADTIISNSSYGTTGGTITQNQTVTDSEKSYCGLSYESFNDSAGSVNGLDTSSDLIEVLINKVSKVNGSASGQLTFHCQYDCLFSIDAEGNMSVSF